MQLTKKYLLVIFLLLSLASCDLFNKNKKLDADLLKTLDNLLKTLDNNQKQALIYFKDKLQDKKYLNDLMEQQKSFLDNLQKKKEDPDLQDRLKKTLNSEYDESQFNKLLNELGNAKAKQFLQQLHIMLQSIKDGTLTSFSSSNFNDLQNLEQKKERALQYINGKLYVEYYFYINGISNADNFFETIMEYLKT
ncbi:MULTISPECIES: hypothetical protein [Borrelia]|uniref:Factor H binding protein n=4 Tax=Borrelia TaxID=138 RepID=Q4U114_BORHE|nr:MULTISPECIES: hypothetical protein [Borrelia]ABQ85667.1 factor H binding protein [Borrelia hermsii]AAY42861.1 factor H-binding protein [Borrelia nietonii YOR]ABQ85674.1 factor H binding protein [Borrelia hermsii HS1] [Borrelia hermsii]ABQ85679.1 factor H binding protein [Borrelia hermsii HS1] [Borrelia hermsii]ABQ85681.1 factor H binding protein [Borrelia hermsii HS1] [Borrelia hermsii]